MESTASCAADTAAAASDNVGKATFPFAARESPTAPPAAGSGAAAGAACAAEGGQATAFAAGETSSAPPTATEQQRGGKTQQPVEHTATSSSRRDSAATAASRAQDLSFWQRDSFVRPTSVAAHVVGNTTTASPAPSVLPPQQRARQQDHPQSAPPPQQQQRQQRQQQVTPPAAALSCFGALARRREVAKEAAAAAVAAQAATGPNVAAAAATAGGGETLAGGGTSQQLHRRSLRVAAGQLEETTPPQSLEWWKICFPTFAANCAASAHDPSSARLQSQQARGHRQLQPQQQQPWTQQQQQQLRDTAAGGGEKKSSVFSPLVDVTAASASPSPPHLLRQQYQQVPVPPAPLQATHLRQTQEGGGPYEKRVAAASSVYATAEPVWGAETSSSTSSSSGSVLQCQRTSAPPAAARGTMRPEAGARTMATAAGEDAIALAAGAAAPAARVLTPFFEAAAAENGAVFFRKEDSQRWADGRDILRNGDPSVAPRSCGAYALVPPAAALPSATASAGLDSVVLPKPRPVPHSSAVDLVCPAASAAAEASAPAATCAHAAASAPPSPSLPPQQQMRCASPLSASPPTPPAAVLPPAPHTAAAYLAEEHTKTVEGAGPSSDSLRKAFYKCAGSPLSAVRSADVQDGAAAAAATAAAVAAKNGDLSQLGNSSTLMNSHSLPRPVSSVRCGPLFRSAAPQWGLHGSSSSNASSDSSSNVGSLQQQPWQQQLQQLLSVELPTRNSSTKGLHVVGGSPFASHPSQSDVQVGSSQSHTTTGASHSNSCSSVTTNSVGGTSSGGWSGYTTCRVAVDDSNGSVCCNNQVAAGVSRGVEAAACGTVVAPPLRGPPTVVTLNVEQQQKHKDPLLQVTQQQQEQDAQSQQQRQGGQPEEAAAACRGGRFVLEPQEAAGVNSCSTAKAAVDLATMERPMIAVQATAVTLNSSSSRYPSTLGIPNGSSSTICESRSLNVGREGAADSFLNGPPGVNSSIRCNYPSSRGVSHSAGSVRGDGSSSDGRERSFQISNTMIMGRGMPGTSSSSGDTYNSSDDKGCSGSGSSSSSVSEAMDFLIDCGGSAGEAARYFSSGDSSTREATGDGMSTAPHRWTPPWCITTVTRGISEPQQGPRQTCRRSGAAAALPSPYATAASFRSASESAEGAARCSPAPHRPVAAAAAGLPRTAAAATATFAACSSFSLAADASSGMTGLRGAFAAGRGVAAAGSSGRDAAAAATGSWEGARAGASSGGLLEVEDLLLAPGGSDVDAAAALCEQGTGDDLLSLEQLPPANLAAVTASRLQPNSMSLRLLQQLLGTLLAGNATVGELTPVGFHVAWMGYQYLQQLQQNPKALLLLVKQQQQQQQQMQQLQQHAGRCRPAQGKQQHGLTNSGAGAGAGAKGNAQAASRGTGSSATSAFHALKQQQHQQQRSTPQQSLAIATQQQTLGIHPVAAGATPNANSRAASSMFGNSGKYASASAVAAAGASLPAKGPSSRTSASRSPSPLSASAAEGSSGHAWRGGGSAEKSRNTSSNGIPEPQHEKSACAAVVEGGSSGAAGGRGKQVAGDAVSRSASRPSGALPGGREEQDRQRRQEQQQQQRRRVQIKKASEGAAAAPLWQTRLGYTDEEWPRYLCGTIDRRWVLRQRNATVPMLQDCNAAPRGRPCKNSSTAAAASRSSEVGGARAPAAAKRDTAAPAGSATPQGLATGDAPATQEEGASRTAAARAAAGGSAGGASGGAPTAAAAPSHEAASGAEGAAGGAECREEATPEAQQQSMNAVDATVSSSSIHGEVTDSSSNLKDITRSTVVPTPQDSVSSLSSRHAQGRQGSAAASEQHEQYHSTQNRQRSPCGNGSSSSVAANNNGSSTCNSEISGKQRTSASGKGGISEQGRESSKRPAAVAAAQEPRQTTAGAACDTVDAAAAVFAAKTCSAAGAPTGSSASAVVAPAAGGGPVPAAASRDDTVAAGGAAGTQRAAGSRSSTSSSSKGKQRTCLSQYEVSVQFEEFSTIAAELMWPDPPVLPDKLHPGQAVQTAYEVRGRFGLWWTDAVLTEVDEAAGLVRCCYVSQHEQPLQLRQRERRQEKESLQQQQQLPQQQHQQTSGSTDDQSSEDIELQGMPGGSNRSDSCSSERNDRSSSARGNGSGPGSESAAKKQAAASTGGGEASADDGGRGSTAAAAAEGGSVQTAADESAAGEGSTGAATAAAAGADAPLSGTEPLKAPQQCQLAGAQVKGEEAIASSTQGSVSSCSGGDTCDVSSSDLAKQQQAPSASLEGHCPQQQQQDDAEQQQQQQQRHQREQQFCAAAAAGLSSPEGVRAKFTQTLLLRDFCAPQVPVAAPAARAWRLLPRRFDPAKDLHPGAVISVAAAAVSLGTASAPVAQTAAGSGAAAAAAGQKTRRGYAAAVARWHRPHTLPAEAAAAAAEGAEARSICKLTSGKGATSSLAGGAAEVAAESRFGGTTAAAAEAESREGGRSTGGVGGPTATVEEECGGRAGRGAGRGGGGAQQQQVAPPYLLRDAVIHRVFQCDTPKTIEAHNALRQQQQVHKKQQSEEAQGRQRRQDCISGEEELENESHVSNSEDQASRRTPLCSSGSNSRNTSSSDSSVKGAVEATRSMGLQLCTRKGPRGRPSPPPAAAAAATSAAAVSATGSARGATASETGEEGQQAGSYFLASASGSAEAGVAQGNGEAAADRLQKTSAAAGGRAAAAPATVPTSLAEKKVVNPRASNDAEEVRARIRGGGACTDKAAATSEETAAATRKEGSPGPALVGVSPRRPRGRPRKAARAAAAGEEEESGSTKSSNNSNSSRSCTSSSSACATASSRMSRSSSSTDSRSPPGRSGTKLLRHAAKRHHQQEEKPQKEKPQEEKQRAQRQQQCPGLWRRGSSRGGGWLKNTAPTRSNSNGRSQRHSGRSPLSKCSRLARGRGTVGRGIYASPRAGRTHQAAAAVVSSRPATAAARLSISPRGTAAARAGGPAGSRTATTAATPVGVEGADAASVKRLRRSVYHVAGNVGDSDQQQTTSTAAAAEHVRELAVAPTPAAVEEEGNRRAGAKRNREDTAVPDSQAAAATAASAAATNTAASKRDAAGTAAVESPYRSLRFTHMCTASATKEKEATTGGGRAIATAVDVGGVTVKSERGTRVLLQGSSSSVSGSPSNPSHTGATTSRSSSSGSVKSSSSAVATGGSGTQPGSSSGSLLSSMSSSGMSNSSRRAQQCYNGLVSEYCSGGAIKAIREDGAADTPPVTYVLLYFPYGDQQRLVTLERLLSFPCYRLPYDLHAHFPPEGGHSVLRQARDFLWAVPRALLPPAAAVAAHCSALNAAAAAAGVGPAATAGAARRAAESLSGAGITAREATKKAATPAQVAEPRTAAATEGGRSIQVAAAQKGARDEAGAAVLGIICATGTAAGQAAGGGGCGAAAAEVASEEAAAVVERGARTGAALEAVRVGVSSAAAQSAAGGSAAAATAEVGEGATAAARDVRVSEVASASAETSAAAPPQRAVLVTAAAATQKQAAATTQEDAESAGPTLKRLCKSERNVETQPPNGGKHAGVSTAVARNSNSSSTANKSASSHDERQSSRKGSPVRSSSSSEVSSAPCGSFESSGCSGASPESAAAAVNRSRSKSVEPQQQRRSPSCSAASGSRRSVKKQKGGDNVKEEETATPAGLSQSPFSLVYVALEDSPFKLPQHMHLLQVLQPELDFAALFEGRWQRLLPQWQRRNSASFLEAIPLFHARAAAAEAAAAAALDATASVFSVGAVATTTSTATAGGSAAAPAPSAARQNPADVIPVERTGAANLLRAAVVYSAAGADHPTRDACTAAGTEQTATKQAASSEITGETFLCDAVARKSQSYSVAAGSLVHGFPLCDAPGFAPALSASPAAASVDDDVAAVYTSLRPATAALFRPSAAVPLPSSTAIPSRVPPAVVAAAARLTAVAASAFPAAAAAAAWSSRGQEALHMVATAFPSLLKPPSVTEVVAASAAASRRNFPCLLHHPSDGPPAPWMCTVALSSWMHAGWKPYMLPASFIPRSCAAAAVAAAVAAVTAARCTTRDIDTPSTEVALFPDSNSISKRDTVRGSTYSSCRMPSSSADSSSSRASTHTNEFSFLAKVKSDLQRSCNAFAGVREAAGEITHSGAAGKCLQSEQQVAAVAQQCQQRTLITTTALSAPRAALGGRLGGWQRVDHDEESSSAALSLTPASAVPTAAATVAPAAAAASPLSTALSNELLCKPHSPFRSTVGGRTRSSLSPLCERRGVLQQQPPQQQPGEDLVRQQDLSQKELREVERGVKERIQFGPTMWPWAQVETLGGEQQDASVGWTWAALTVYEELLLLRLQQQQQAAAAASAPRWQLSAPYESSTDTFIRKILDRFPAHQQEEEEIICLETSSSRAGWPAVTGTEADAAVDVVHGGLVTHGEGAAFAPRENTFVLSPQVTEISSSGRDEQATAPGSRNRKRPLASVGTAATGAAGEAAIGAAGKRSPKPEEERGVVSGKSAPTAATATAAGRAGTVAGRGAAGVGAAGGKSGVAGKAAAQLTGTAGVRTGKKNTAATAGEGAALRGGHVEGHVTSTTAPSPCSSSGTGSSNSSNACTQQRMAAGERSSSSSSQTCNSKSQQESQQASGVSEAANGHAPLAVRACSPGACVHTRTPLDVLQSAAAQLMREKTLAAGRLAHDPSPGAGAVKGPSAKAAVTFSTSREGRKGPAATRGGGKKSFRTLLNGVRRTAAAGAAGGPHSRAAPVAHIGGVVTRTGGEGSGGGGVGAAGRTTGGERRETPERGAPGVIRGGKKACGVGITVTNKQTRGGDTPKTEVAIKKKKAYSAIRATTATYAARRSARTCPARRGSHRLLRKPSKPTGASSHTGRSSSVQNSSSLKSDNSRSCSTSTQKSNHVTDGGPKSAKEKRISMHSPRSVGTRGGAAGFAVGACLDDLLDATQFAEVRELRLHFSSASVSPPDDTDEAAAAADPSQRPAAPPQRAATTASDTAAAAEGSGEGHATPGEGRGDRFTAATEGSFAAVGSALAAVAKANKGRSVAAASRTSSCAAAAQTSVGVCSSAPTPQRPPGVQRQRHAREREKNREGEGK